MVTQSRLLFCSACAVILILSCAGAGCTSSQSPTTPTAITPAPSTGSNSILIKNFAFSPDTLTIKTGTTVTWTNQDTPPHQIASDAGVPVAFSSGSLSTGATYQFTFTTPGTYPYHCSIHPTMKASIVVQS